MSKAMTQDELNAALIAAAKDGNVREAGVLIGKGASIEVADGWLGNQPLHWAVFHGHKEMAELLLAKGAGLDASNSYGWQPLHCAARNGHREMAGMLLAKGARVDAADNGGDQPLHHAARNRRMEVAVLLLEHGADPAALNNRALTPRYFCDYEDIRALLEAAEREWQDPGERMRKVLAVIRAWQRKLGSLRPKGPTL